MVKFTFFPNCNEVTLHADDILLGTYDATELVKALGQAQVIASKHRKLNDVDSSEYQVPNV